MLEDQGKFEAIGVGVAEVMLPTNQDTNPFEDFCSDLVHMMHVSSGGDPKWPDLDPRGASNVTFTAVKLCLTVKAAKDWAFAI